MCQIEKKKKLHFFWLDNKVLVMLGQKVGSLAKS